jgi:hypothetical protein
MPPGVRVNECPVVRATHLRSGARGGDSRRAMPVQLAAIGGEDDGSFIVLPDGQVNRLAVRARGLGLLRAALGYLAPRRRTIWAIRRGAGSGQRLRGVAVGRAPAGPGKGSVAAVRLTVVIPVGGAAIWLRPGSSRSVRPRGRVRWRGWLGALGGDRLVTGRVRRGWGFAGAGPDGCWPAGMIVSGPIGRSAPVAPDLRGGGRGQLLDGGLGG